MFDVAKPKFRAGSSMTQQPTVSIMSVERRIMFAGQVARAERRYRYKASPSRHHPCAATGAPCIYKTTQGGSGPNGVGLAA
ncbi:hypothetical protein J1614_002671 [Plenodomus biglobosus]|nr:hypothetical protein J1614_002671 [Plenodomus biglobosus]